MCGWLRSLFGKRKPPAPAVPSLPPALPDPDPEPPILPPPPPAPEPVCEPVLPTPGDAMPSLPIPYQPEDATCYPDAAAHLAEELVRIDYLCRALMIRRLRPGEKWELFAELGFPLGEATLPPTELPVPLRDQWEMCIEAARYLRAWIDRRLDLTKSADTFPLKRLAAAFHLEAAELDAVLVTLLATVQPRVARWFAAINGDERRTEPTVGALIETLAPVHPTAHASVLFHPDHSLLGLGVMRLSGGNEAVPRQSARIAERIAGFLRGAEALDPDLADLARWANEPGQWNLVFLDPERLEMLRRLAAWYRNQQGTPLVFLLLGAERGAQRSIARAFLPEASLLVIDVALAARQIDTWPRVVEAAYREARLTKAAVFWRSCDALHELPETAAVWEVLTRRAEQYPGLTWIETTRMPPAPTGSRVHRFFDFEVPPPGFDLRRRLWTLRLFGKNKPTSEEQDLVEQLANSFQMTEGQISDAITIAKRKPRPTTKARPDTDTSWVSHAEILFEACRRLSARQLIGYARRITPGPKQEEQDPLDALIVPVPTRRQIEELIIRNKFRGHVYADLGFERKLSLGKGLVALFYGTSGTGKTMAAGIVAARAGVDLYKIDLSVIQSKYVGDAEKHLARVFAEAEAANAFLFFDEADSLFGKRGEIRDAQDRWANMQINYLLQRVEEFTGTVILATNLRQNIDEAFQRRIHAIVEFPFPEAGDRFAILRGLFPNDELRPAETDLWEVANRFPLAGGSLKNVVLDAVFRAVGRGVKKVEARHLAAAVAREYQKLGKPITRGDFGDRFFGFVTEELFEAPKAEKAQAG